MKAPVLQIHDLGMCFGGIDALKAVNLEVFSDEITALIGPNGAGKTTLFNCITGIYTPTSGNVVLQSPHCGQVRLNGLKPNQVTHSGLARTFQGIRLFQNMTVLENVMIGRFCRTKSFIMGALLRNRATRREEQDTLERSYQILHRFGLADEADELASNLSYGAQRRLEIARAIATEPSLLLLDEPAAGMNPKETEALEMLIRQLHQDGQAVLLIEHDMPLVMNLSHRIYVLDYGHLIAAGTPQEVRNNPAVIKAYLGEADDA